MGSIGFIGGTGDLGRALAFHLAKSQNDVILGSREYAKAEAVVTKIIQKKGATGYLVDHLRPATNVDVVDSSDLVISTLPHEIAVQTIEGLKSHFRAGQLLVSGSAPVEMVGQEFRVPSSHESITQKIRNILPREIEVATAFQTIPAIRLYREDKMSCDVFVCCDSEQTYSRMSDTILKIEGLRPLYVGSLALSVEVERLTALLLNISAKNHMKSPTFKISSF